MAGRGVLFAITDEDVRALEARDGSDEVVAYVADVIEDRWEEGFVYEVDKAWDAIHRCLSDGILDLGAGEFPLNAAILGRQALNAGGEYFIGLTRAVDVSAVADALRQLDGDWIRTAYRTKVPADYAPEYGEQDMDYTIGWFEGLPTFWQLAAESGRSVIFTVDQ